jgi:hypothetical protein
VNMPRSLGAILSNAVHDSNKGSRLGMMGCALRDWTVQSITRVGSELLYTA